MLYKDKLLNDLKVVERKLSSKEEEIPKEIKNMISLCEREECSSAEFKEVADACYKKLVELSSGGYLYFPNAIQRSHFLGLLQNHAKAAFRCKVIAEDFNKALPSANLRAHFVKKWKVSRIGVLNAKQRETGNITPVFGIDNSGYYYAILVEKGVYVIVPVFGFAIGPLIYGIHAMSYVFEFSIKHGAVYSLKKVENIALFSVKDSSWTILEKGKVEVGLKIGAKTKIAVKEPVKRKAAPEIIIKNTIEADIIGFDFDVGIAEIKGEKMDLKDDHTILKGFGSREDCLFAGLYHSVYYESQGCQFVAAGIVHKQIMESYNKEKNVRKCFENAYEKSSVIITHKTPHKGAWAADILIDKNKIFAASAGVCKIWIFKNNSLIYESPSDVIGNKEEYERVIREGGKVSDNRDYFNRNYWWTRGLGFGNAGAGFSNIPHVKEIETNDINENDFLRIIITSSSYRKSFDHIIFSGNINNSSKEIAEGLLDIAISEFGRESNISFIVISLKPKINSAIIRESPKVKEVKKTRYKGKEAISRIRDIVTERSRKKELERPLTGQVSRIKVLRGLIKRNYKRENRDYLNEIDEELQSINTDLDNAIYVAHNPNQLEELSQKRDLVVSSSRIWDGLRNGVGIEEFVVQISELYKNSINALEVKIKIIQQYNLEDKDWVSKSGKVEAKITSPSPNSAIHLGCSIDFARARIWTPKNWKELYGSYLNFRWNLIQDDKDRAIGYSSNGADFIVPSDYKEGGAALKFTIKDSKDSIVIASDEIAVNLVKPRVLNLSVSILSPKPNSEIMIGTIIPNLDAEISGPDSKLLINRKVRYVEFRWILIKNKKTQTLSYSLKGTSVVIDGILETGEAKIACILRDEINHKIIDYKEANVLLVQPPEINGVRIKIKSPQNGSVFERGKEIENLEGEAFGEVEIIESVNNDKIKYLEFRWFIIQNGKEQHLGNGRVREKSLWDIKSDFKRGNSRLRLELIDITRKKLVSSAEINIDLT